MIIYVKNYLSVITYPSLKLVALILNFLQFFKDDRISLLQSL